MLLAELPELGRIYPGQIAKLVGVAPLSKDSFTTFWAAEALGQAVRSYERSFT